MKTRLILTALSSLFLAIRVVASEHETALDNEFWKTATLAEVEELFEKGVDINTKSDNDYTPLMFAAGLNPYPDVIEWLVASGADIKAKSKSGATALTTAIIFQARFEMMECLIQLGADVNAEDNLGVTALMQAAFLSPDPKLIDILINSGALISARDAQEWTALMYAARSNKNPDVIDALIKSGAHINAQENKGNTALIMAVVHNKNPETVTRLVELGADVDICNSTGLTPLMALAVLRQSPELLELLVTAGADINARTNGGETVLMQAAHYSRHSENIATLVRLGADTSATNRNGKTALDYAKKNKALHQPKTLRMLTGPDGTLHPDKLDHVLVVEQSRVIQANHAGETTVLLDHAGYAGTMGDTIYVRQGPDIMVYDAKGEWQRSIPIPSEVGSSYFVVLPDQRIAFLDNRNDAIFIADKHGRHLRSISICDDLDRKLKMIDGVVVGTKLIVLEDGHKEVLAIDLESFDVSVFRSLKHLHGWISSIAHCDGVYYISQCRNIYSFSRHSKGVRKVATTPESNITGLVAAHGRLYAVVNGMSKIKVRGLKEKRRTQDGALYEIDLGSGVVTEIKSALNFPQQLLLLKTEEG